MPHPLKALSRYLQTLSSSPTPSTPSPTSPHPPTQIESVEDIFTALTGQGTLEWIGQNKEAAVLYYSARRHQYKIYFDDSNVEVSIKKRLFQNEYWDSLGVRHYTEPEDSLQDVFDTVMWCRNEFGKKE